MKVFKVTYTTKAEFSEQNQKNIKNVMDDLRKLNHPGVNYNSCLSADGKTFTHTVFLKSDEDQNVISQLPAFKYFQEQLQASGLEVPPKQETLELVGSSKEIF